jgi:hypothetical protein
MKLVGGLLGGGWGESLGKEEYKVLWGGHGWG